MDSNFQSWGRFPTATPRGILTARHLCEPLPAAEDSLLPYGNGRSYGDSCLNNGAYLLSTRRLDRFIEFDRRVGRLRCEAGVLLSDILALVVGSGWFLPVTPGTQFVTLGGAVANDVHGKNHHTTGTFGHHVTSFELLRSSGERLLCSREQNHDKFVATIGGLGLTGLILWVELTLKPISNPWVRVETTRFDNLDGFFDLAGSTDGAHEYTVAWIDSLASGKRLGRGLFIAGNHAAPSCPESPAAPRMRLRVPFDPPVSLIRQASLKGFNAVFYHKQFRRRVASWEHYAPFFYPLDGILEWNRIYGPNGLLQYQSVVPMDAAREATSEMLSRIATSGQGSFLSVLKVFGDMPSAGLMSFPRPGVTLALDFPYLGEATERLLNSLDVIVSEAGGALYPAKDARMPGSLFTAGYPRLEQFEREIDPAFSSSFWRRVTGG